MSLPALLEKIAIPTSFMCNLLASCAICSRMKDATFAASPWPSSAPFLCRLPGAGAKAPPGQEDDRPDGLF
jgi:hypothetical protein